MRLLSLRRVTVGGGAVGGCCEGGIGDAEGGSGSSGGARGIGLWRFYSSPLAIQLNPSSRMGGIRAARRKEEFGKKRSVAQLDAAERG